MSASLEKGSNKAHDRCTICKIKSYSFCRCLQDEQLKGKMKVPSAEYGEHNIAVLFKKICKEFYLN